jgi:hypothetical protein
MAGRLVLGRFLERKLFFDGHIAKFAGFEDLSTEFAFNELSVFIARDYAHTWVLTGL